MTKAPKAKSVPYANWYNTQKPKTKAVANNNCNRYVKHNAISVKQLREYDNDRLFLKLKQNKMNIRMIERHGFRCSDEEFGRMVVVTCINIDRIMDEIGRRMGVTPHLWGSR
jgi:hypothetical protein